MEAWLWAVIGIMALIIAGLLIKIALLRRAAREIAEGFAERLAGDTNTLIGLSTRDRRMQALASTVNTQLKQLREAQRRFQQGDAELKSAVTNISHDLRTPLTAIFGYLDLLEQEEQSETVARYLSVIRGRAETLAQLTEELFRYSVILAAEDCDPPEEVAVNAVLEESIAAFYAAFKERNIIPRIELPEANIIRTLDRSSLSRVFSNLLSNALKYSDGDLEITLSDDGKITFSNHASGLDEIQVGQLFDRFYTVEAARRSTGLGLAIARTLVERMGGSITADYENNRLSICVFLI